MPLRAMTPRTRSGSRNREGSVRKTTRSLFSGVALMMRTRSPRRRWLPFLPTSLLATQLRSRARSADRRRSQTKPINTIGSWNEGVINNEAGSIFNFTSDVSIFDQPGAFGTFNNSGTLRKSAGAGNHSSRRENILDFDSHRLDDLLPTWPAEGASGERTGYEVCSGKGSAHLVGPTSLLRNVFALLTFFFKN